MITIRDLVKKRHIERSSDPVYMEGFTAIRGKKNPYKFPEKSCTARMLIANKKGMLSDKEKRLLVMWNKRIEKTKWSRWSTGYWSVGKV